MNGSRRFTSEYYRITPNEFLTTCRDERHDLAFALRNVMKFKFAVRSRENEIDGLERVVGSHAI